jgi:hypothetical protein
MPKTQGFAMVWVVPGAALDCLRCLISAHVAAQLCNAQNVRN